MTKNSTTNQARWTLGLCAFLCMAMTSLVFAADDEKASPCNATISVTPTKHSYIYGEPIELTATFSIDRLPYYGGNPLVSTLELKDPHDQLVPRDYGTGDEYLDRILSGTPSKWSLSKAIKSGERGLATVYLQDYFASPKPGSYEVQYDATCPGTSASETIAARGTITFEVEAQSEKQMQDTLDALDRGLQTGDVDKAGAELTDMDTPLILPLLTERFDLLVYRVGAGPVFQALSRFKDNPGAEDLVRCSVLSPNPSKTLPALAVLLKWKTRLPEYRIDRLLHSAEQQVRIATLHYIRGIGDSAYLPLVTGLLHDSDTKVASEAEETKRSIEAARN